ncbi:hypothetical protein VNO80_03869 [Phaseolus coccineus]|uniref:Uncharacterized protein n=1 Tax=Phaseolus coccineus TaxID=3886 RepID=A0AAN9NZQ8_PHACN
MHLAKRVSIRLNPHEQERYLSTTLDELHIAFMNEANTSITNKNKESEVELAQVKVHGDSWRQKFLMYVFCPSIPTFQEFVSSFGSIFRPHNPNPLKDVEASALLVAAVLVYSFVLGSAILVLAKESVFLEVFKVILLVVVLPFGEGASINRPPLFCGLNYQFWKVRIKIFMESLDKGIWDAIENGPFIPKFEKDGSVIEKPWSQWTDAESKKAKFDCIAKNIITSALNSDEFLGSHNANHQKKCGILWKSLMKEQMRLKEIESKLSSKSMRCLECLKVKQ